MGLKQVLRRRFPHLYFSIRNGVENRRLATAGQRFLVARHSSDPRAYDLLLTWLGDRFPEVRRHFEVQLLPCRIKATSRYALHIPWLQDPVQHWSAQAYAQAMRLSADCDACGIPIVNRVERLTNAGKSATAARLAQLGIRTPRIVPIGDVETFRQTACGLQFPLIVREDWGHGGAMLRARDFDELRNLPIETLARPIAVEFIDVESEGGLYRKYRYLLAGDRGVPLHVHVSRDWVTKGTNCEYGAALVQEETAYVNATHPQHDLLVRAREALELDFVAFDHAYDREGRLVVWEANPYPYLHFPRATGRRTYRRPAIERALAAMTGLYLDRAGLPVPPGLDDIFSVAPTHDSPNRLPAAFIPATGPK